MAIIACQPPNSMQCGMGKCPHDLNLRASCIAMSYETVAWEPTVCDREINYNSLHIPVPYHNLQIGRTVPLH